jgi:hypothetical protein
MMRAIKRVARQFGCSDHDRNLFFADAVDGWP